MNTDAIEQSFKKSVTESVRLFPEGVGRYRVFTPFHFDDGDHFVIVLRKEETGRWVLTDEGNTYMHMSYAMDVSTLKSGTRNKIIEDALEKYRIQERKGRIVAELENSTNPGNVFYNFVQCLISINNVSYLSRERVVSTFMEDFRNFMSETIDAERIIFDYFDKKNDPSGKYHVDCRINGTPRPLHVYGIFNDSKCQDATIFISQFQRKNWDSNFTSLGIFEDQEKINRRVLARFTDFCDRQFSSLATNQDKIVDFLRNRAG